MIYFSLFFSTMAFIGLTSGAQNDDVLPLVMASAFFALLSCLRVRA